MGKINKRKEKKENKRTKNKKNTTDSLENCIKKLNRSINQNNTYLKENNKLFGLIICSLKKNKNKSNKLLNY